MPVAVRRPPSLLLWALLALGAALPLVAGPALAAALDSARPAVRTLCSLALWAGWAVGLLSAAVPHPLALTALRVLAPAGVVCCGAALLRGNASAAAPALLLSAVVAALAFAPAVGLRSVNGPAYGDERRYPLRAPGVLLVGPGVLAWALALAGLTAGPLLMAAGQWVVGGTVTAVGIPVGMVLLRSLHGLSRRWAVFVPAGLVLHDPLTLADPVLFRRSSVVRLGPAPAGTDGLDLTHGAPGLVMELELAEPVELVLMRPGHRSGDKTRARAVLFMPTRPGLVLAEAAARRFPVG